VSSTTALVAPVLWQEKAFDFFSRDLAVWVGCRKIPLWWNREPIDHEFRASCVLRLSHDHWEVVVQNTLDSGKCFTYAGRFFL
jgi:hypothetical protein